jgi:predicted porin
MGKTTLAAQYGTGKKEGADSSTDTGDRSGYQVAAIYSLSKRTNAYVAYGSQDLKYTQGTYNGNTEKVTATAIGLRHAF